MLRPWSRGSSQVGSGGTTGSPRRGGPTSRTSARGPRTCCSWCSTTSGSRSSGASAPTSPPPHLDRLAAGGLRYSNFHTTALCSPTRACVLTGRNHHAVGMGRIVDLATGFPGYDARIPRVVRACCPAMLTPHGYAAYAVGKWHLTPEDEEHLGARRDRWPLGPGLRALLRLLRRRDPPVRARRSSTTTTTSSRRSSIDDGYHLTDGPRRPRHRVPRRPPQRRRRQAVVPLPGDRRLPLAAPVAAASGSTGTAATSTGAGTRGARPTLARQKADGLLPRAHRAVAAARLGAGVGLARSATEQRVYARYMEAFAGFLSHTDARARSAGRPPRGDSGELDNTVVVVLSDNGASSEGGPVGLAQRRPGVERAPPHGGGGGRAASTRSAGRASTTTTRGAGRSPATRPFRRWKRETHEGGVADPLIVHWPAGIPARGEVRTPVRPRHRHRADAARGDRHRPARRGRRRRAAAARRRQLRLRPSTTPTRPSATPPSTTRCSAAGRCTTTGGRPSSTSEIQRDEPGPRRGRLGAVRPARRPVGVPRPRRPSTPSGSPRMVDRWWAEAERNQVLPLDNRPFSELVFGRTPSVAPRSTYTYWPGRAPVPESVAVNVRGRPHTITAHVTIDPRARRRRGRARRAGIGARRLVVPPAGRRAPLLRAQPRRLARCTGSRPTSGG